MAEKKKRRAGILFAEALGYVLAAGAFCGGASYALFGSHLALVVGVVLGIGVGLIVALEGES